MNPEGYYHADLARVHHQDYGQIAQKAAAAALEMLQSRGRQAARVIDLGCGSGIVAQVLSEAGHRVTGVDYSASMLEIAQKVAPQADFVQASLFDYELPDCDLVIASGEAINYLFDEKSTSQALSQLFERMYQALKPGGLLVFDLLTPGTLGEQNPTLKIVEQENWTMFLQVAEDEDSHILSREIHLFTKEGELYRKSRELHRQQLYHPEAVRAQLRSTGFRVRLAQAYADYPLRKGHFAFFCEK